VGVFAPAGIPPAIVARLNADIDRVIHDPEVAANLDKQGLMVQGGKPDVLGRLVSTEIARWTAVARDGNIRVEP
jgi:tripartite-type tricarboxylate transporter receptor subunit TctC